MDGRFTLLGPDAALLARELDGLQLALATADAYLDQVPDIMVKTATSESQSDHIQRPITSIGLQALLRSNQTAERNIVQAASAVGIL